MTFPFSFLLLFLLFLLFFKLNIIIHIKLIYDCCRTYTHSVDSVLFASFTTLLFQLKATADLGLQLSVIKLAKENKIRRKLNSFKSLQAGKNVNKLEQGEKRERERLHESMPSRSK